MVAKEIATNDAMNDAKLRQITNLQDAMTFVAEEYGGVVSVSEELGNGFTLLAAKDKSRLVDRPFLIVATSMHSGGKFGDGIFCTVAAVTLDTGDRVLFNDGSSGICQQIRELRDSGRTGGWSVENGLRASTYPTCPNCNRPRPHDEDDCGVCDNDSEARHEGTTYYLSV